MTKRDNWVKIKGTTNIGCKTHSNQKSSRIFGKNDVCPECFTELEAENERLKTTLDGDPNQTATPEERKLWRRTAVEYADGLEKKIQSLEHDVMKLNGQNIDKIREVAKLEQELERHNKFIKEIKESISLDSDYAWIRQDIKEFEEEK